MLEIAGYINFTIALAHVFGLIWADTMFRLTGINEIIQHLALVHWSLPYMLTFLVANMFVLFGFYALSACGKVRKLPFLQFVIFVIAAIYLLRGLGGIVSSIISNVTSTLDPIYSIVAFLIGCLYIFGEFNIDLVQNDGK